MGLPPPQLSWEHVNNETERGILTVKLMGFFFACEDILDEGCPPTPSTFKNYATCLTCTCIRIKILQRCLEKRVE